MKEFFSNSNSKVGKNAKYSNHIFQDGSTWVQSRHIEVHGDIMCVDPIRSRVDLQSTRLDLYSTMTNECQTTDDF